MKFRINPLMSDIVISIYIAVSLYFRFKLEDENGVSPMVSLVMGALLLLFLWALIKLKILNPNYFGLFKTKNTKS